MLRSKILKKENFGIVKSSEVSLLRIMQFIENHYTNVTNIFLEENWSTIIKKRTCAEKNKDD